MEEILASIRRIIADEETAPKSKAAAPPPEPELASAPDETISEDDLDKLFASADDPEDEVAEDDDVLDLTEELAEPESGPPLVEGMGETSDLAFADVAETEEAFEEPAPAPAPIVAPVAAAPVAPPRPAPEPAPMPRAFAPDPVAVEAAVSPLISQASEGMIASAFADLSMTVINRNARTLDDLVQEMLRPMLQQWLDRNLPTMVERMVRAEIERVTRGR